MNGEKTNPQRNPWLLMPVVLVLWGSFAAVSKKTLGDMDSFQLQFWLFAIAAIILTVRMALRGGFAVVRSMKASEVLPILFGGLLYFLYYFLYTLSLKLIPAIEASMLNYLFPVMVVLFDIPVNKARFTARKAASITLGFFGVLVILTGGNFSSIRFTNLPGDLLTVGAAASWGGFSSLGKQSGADAEACNWFYVLESLTLSAVGLALFSRPAIPRALPLLGIVWLSLSNIVLALPLWLRALRSLPTAVVASCAFITPFVTLLFIVLLLGESLTWSQAAGLLITVCAIAMQGIGQGHAQPRP